MKKSKKGNGIIAMSFIIAIMLTALPLPDWAVNWRPDWVAVVLIYWCMAVPDRIGIFIAWFLGLLLDVQQGNILGQNALSMTLIAFLTINSYQRMRAYPLLQQAVLVCFYLLLYKLVMLLILVYLGLNKSDWTYWMPAITSMLLWPWLFIILRDVRRKHRIS
ncbi:MAG: rod shape-determining protein MreD [Legionellales bacterium]|nr:rod shape-determining protein MreD [Legionellales bacterium]|tara:strand:+ start:114 stop:599 length:486 start_codon:yes stop_codon:yes gene_type:complete